MPVYVYEAKEGAQGCGKCRGGFEISQSIKDPRLERCPDCGGEIFRVIQAPGLGHSKTDLHYRAKRAGFNCLKKVSKGEYEKMY
jgi:putative FmdB family regulatory protein